jgi:pimeloyl-ACP methyl ester carboxylesterase
MTPQTRRRAVAAIALPVLLLQVPPANAAPVQPAAVAPAAMRFNHISVTAEGKGPPIILIPGLSSPRAVWDGATPFLTKTHRVYLVQINGFGGDDPGANLQPGILDGVVADLEDLIARERLGRPAMVGHSLGGLVALKFAKAHPERVSRIMVVDSLPFYGMLIGPTTTPESIRTKAAAMRDHLAASYGKSDPAGAQAVADHLALKPDSRAKVKAWVLAADPRVAGEAMFEDLQTDLRGDMAKITTPITLIYPWSDSGPTKPAADTLYRGAYSAAPHVTFVDVGDAAHFVMLDQPEAFGKALQAFADAR